MKREKKRPEAARVEPLEARTLLFAGPPPYPFVGVGIAFDTATDLPAGMYWAEGTVHADDSFTGSYERFDASGRYGAETLPWAGFARPDNDRMALIPAPGFEGYAAQTGSQFIAEQGFPMGTFAGRDASGAVRDVGVFVEPYMFSGGIWVGVYLQQDYLLATMAVMTPERGLEEATLVATPAFFKSSSWTFEYRFASGAIETFSVSVVSATGVMTEFDNGVRIYSSQRGSTNFFVLDTNAADGVVGYGVGYARWVAAPDSVSAAGIPGLYRGNVVTSGTASAGFFGAEGAGPGFSGAGVAEVVISIEDDGDFALYRAHEYDQGLREPFNGGRWSYLSNPRQFRELDLGRLQMVDWDGRIATFRPASRAAAILVPKSVSGLGSSSASPDGESVIGLFTFGHYTPISEELDFQQVFFSTDPAGHVVAYQHAISSDPGAVGWYVLDLVEAVGGEAVSGPIYAWHDFNFERAAVVGRTAAGDLLFWERLYDRWTFTNLTESIEGAERFGGEIAGANIGLGDFFRRPQAAIVGTDAEGKFIAYVQRSGSEWDFVPIEANGLLGEGVHPNIVGPLAGFGAPWGGINFTGLDDQGRIWALWHSRALGDKWATHNLSEIAGGTPTIVSHLTGITTPWNAFHITGLDSRGHIIVTWWAHSVGWRYDGLTELVGGPAFTGVEIASNYNLELNVINVIGIDASGNAVVYWWNPKSGWNVGYPATGLSAETRPAGTIVFDGFRARYTSIPGLTAGFQTITWRRADGHVMHIEWYSEAPDAWRLEDLTEIAQPL